MATHKNVALADIDEERNGSRYRILFELPSSDGITTTVFRAASVEAAHGVIDQRIAHMSHAAVVVDTEPVAEKPEPVAEKPEPVAEKPEPVAEKLEPVAEKPEPVAEKPEPVAEKPEPVAEKPAPRKPTPGRKPRR